jgi:hypothetical protein
MRLWFWPISDGFNLSGHLLQCFAVRVFADDIFPQILMQDQKQVAGLEAVRDGVEAVKRLTETKVAYGRATLYRIREIL